jgi:hypothetical protein
VRNADVGAGEHGVECGGEPAVAVADQEPELVDAVAEVDGQVAGLVGAENRVTSCDIQVLVDEAAEPVSSEHADGVSILRASTNRPDFAR